MRLEAGRSQVKKELHLVCDGNLPKEIKLEGITVCRGFPGR